MGLPPAMPIEAAPAPPAGRRNWERLPGEPRIWFDRFERFVRLGPGRSVLAIYKAERQGRDKAREGMIARSVPAAWTNAGNRWWWRERAEGFDRAESERKWVARREFLAVEWAAIEEDALATGKTLGGIGKHMVTMFGRWIAKVGPDGLDGLNPSELPAFVRAACKAIETSNNLRSFATGLDAVMEQFVKDEQSIKERAYV